MQKILATLVILFTLAVAPLTAGCSWFRHEASVAKTALIDCAKAEEAVVTNGTDLVSVFFDIAMNFAEAVASGNAGAAVTALAAKYGEPIVACVMKTIAAPSAGASGSGSSSPGTSAEPSDPFSAAARVAIAQHGWQFAK